MHTRCPQCQTVFRLTAAQLKARGGQVRCGRCQNVFRADEHLVDAPAKPAGKAPGAPRKRTPRKPLKAEEPPASGKTEPLSTPVQPGSIEPTAEPAIMATAGTPLPILTTPRARTRTLYWALGSTLLVLLLISQTLVFYGHETGRHAPFLKPAIQLACTTLPCRRLPPVDMQRLDLVETQVTPHPRYDRALRIKAVMVNRAEYTQPYPLLEVTLIDSQGQLLARRLYPPQEYLRKPEKIAAGLPPQIATSVQLDITSPGAQATGYEILLLPPSE